MKRLEEVLEEKQASSAWSRQMAGRVLAVRRARRKAYGVLAAAALVCFVTIGSLVTLQRAPKEESLKDIFSSAMEEVNPSSETSGMISLELGNK